MAIPFVVVVLFMSQLPYSCARKLQEQPPALEFPPPLPEDLLCPPPSPSPMALLPPEFPIPQQPSQGLEFPPPLPDDVACPPPPPPPQTQCPQPSPETTSLYYFPPPPMIFLPPPPAPEFSPVLRWLSRLGSAAVVALLLLGCKMILTPRAASTQPVRVDMQVAGVTIEMQAL